MSSERSLQLWRGGVLLTLVLEETTGRNYQILRLVVGSISRQITVKPEMSGLTAVQLVAPYVAEGFSRRGRRPRWAEPGPLSKWARGVHHEAALRVANPGAHFSLFGEVCPDCGVESAVERHKDRKGAYLFRFLCCGRIYY